MYVRTHPYSNLRSPCSIDQLASKWDLPRCAQYTCQTPQLHHPSRFIRSHTNRAKIRFWRAVYTHLFHRRRQLPAPAHLFSPLTTASRSSTYECDFNGHKSNSTYFSDLDIARCHLVCHLTKGAFARRRARAEPAMYVALAGVTALFRREIRPLAAYVVSSRVLGWDRKWLFVVSHFVSAGAGERVVYASCLSKYVFKSGRRTVPPEVVLAESGLLPPRPDAASGCGSGADTPLVGLREGRMGEQRVEDAVERIRRAVGAKDLVAEDVERVPEEGYWTWERIEAERKRGLELADHMMELDGLADEYREGDEEGLEKIGGFFNGW